MRSPAEHPVGLDQPCDHGFVDTRMASSSPSGSALAAVEEEDDCFYPYRTSRPRRLRTRSRGAGQATHPTETYYTVSISNIPQYFKVYIDNVLGLDKIRLDKETFKNLFKDFNLHHTNWAQDDVTKNCTYLKPVTLFFKNQADRDKALDFGNGQVGFRVGYARLDVGSPSAVEKNWVPKQDLKKQTLDDGAASPFLSF